MKLNNSGSINTESGSNFRWLFGLTTPESQVVHVKDFNALKRLIKGNFGKGVENEKPDFLVITLEGITYECEKRKEVWRVEFNEVLVGHLDKRLLETGS